MGDLKTLFDNPVCPIPEFGGTGVTSRGSDPQVDLSGTSGLQTLYDKPGTTAPSGEETANSVSGLPLRPNRNEPSPAVPPTPPSLEKRNPGTIDR